MGRMSTGALDNEVSLADQLRSDVDYDRPRGGGEALLDLVGDLRGKRILDVGCGMGPFREPFEARGAEWIGLDLKGPGCSVIGSGERLPFADGSFDGVLCAAVLEHLPEPGALMAEVRRVLVTRGMFFGYVAFLEPLHGMSYYHMSHMGLEHLLCTHGFRPRRIFASRIGTGYQIECMLFPRYVPVLQPFVRALTQWSFGVLLGLNRFARQIFRVVHPRRRPHAEDRRQYRRLLELRFAVGFNFVAERTDTTESNAPSGYDDLVR